jgi:hypothetical protein
MSDRITWGVCPTCGSRAAVLWVAVAVRDGESVSERPVELICLGRFDHTLWEQLGLPRVELTPWSAPCFVESDCWIFVPPDP